VQQLAGVFLQMNALDADGFGAAGARNDNLAVAAHRLVGLGNLIGLRQVRIEILFSRKKGFLIDAAAERQPRFHNAFHRFFIQHRQNAGLARAHGADVRVRRRAKVGFARTEQLRCGFQLNMHFEPNNGLVFLFGHGFHGGLRL
jgi:hypothetical protein